MGVKIFAVIVAALFVGCASKPKVPVLTNENREHDFDRGSKLLEHEDFAGAAEVFDSLLVKKPGSETDLMAIYNSGASYEGMGQCKKASDRYREVVRASAGKYSRLEAQSLYRLSLMYECLGQDAKTIAALLDAKRRGADLVPELSRAELPARLAAAYARAGNRQKALYYFGQASEGLKQVLSDTHGSRRQRDVLGQTLYQMGKLSPSQRDAVGDPIAYLLSLSMQQPYLLQAIELAPPRWAKRAEEDLTIAYQNLRTFRMAPDKQNEFGLRALETINELRRIRMPDANPAEEAIFVQVDKAERLIQNEMNLARATLPLTPEAESRESLRRQGRPVDPGAKPNPPSRRTE